MKKSTVKKILKIYLKFRTIFSPIAFKKWYKVPIEKEYWFKVKKYDMDDFCYFINNFPYISDKFLGLIDVSFPSNCPDYFFQDLKIGRDCDDFARIWRLWSEENKMIASEYVFLNIKRPFQTAHVVCIAKDKNENYWLFNYINYGPFLSFEKVIDFMKQDDDYKKDGIYEKYNHEMEKK